MGYTKNELNQFLIGEHKSQIGNVTVGYVPEIPEEKKMDRAIGERWTDSDGKLWEQKDGYRVCLGTEALDELRNDLRSFPNCPKETCSCELPKRLDEKMRAIHGMCFQCVVEKEHKMRMEGTWDAYERDIIRKNAESWLKDADKEVEILAQQLSKVEHVNEFGDIEKLVVPQNMSENVRKNWKRFRRKLKRGLLGKNGK